MKRLVERLNESEVRRDYPISSELVGWFFRVREVSNSVFIVDGTDLWGRTVSRTGVDEFALLAMCVEDARAIETRL